MIRQWGPPANVYSTGDKKFLSYSQISQGYVPGVSPTYQTQVIGNTAYTRAVGGTSGYTYTNQCVVVFEISGGIVHYWRWEGNSCRS